MSDSENRALKMASAATSPTASAYYHNCKTFCYEENILIANLHSNIIKTIQSKDIETKYLDSHTNFNYSTD